MNIFWLHPEPEVNAKMHVDRHVNKMLTESVQILCTSSYINGHSEFWMYEPYQPNNPVVKWAKESYANWSYLYELAEELYSEYRYRYGMNNDHNAGEVLGKFDTDTVEKVFSVTDTMTEPHQGVKDWPRLDEDYSKSHGLDMEIWADGFGWPHVVEAYRYYYVGDKSHIAKWKIRGKPDWWDRYEDTYDDFMRSQGCGSKLNS